MTDTGCMTVAEDHFFSNNIEVLKQESSGAYTFYLTDEGEYATDGVKIFKKIFDNSFTEIKKD